MNNQHPIVIHPPMEMMYALFALGTRQHFLNMLSDFGLTPEPEMTEWLDEISSPMSLFLQQELSYFFDLSGLGYLFYKSILRYSGIPDPAAVIDRIESDGPGRLMDDMMGSVCKEVYPGSGIKGSDYKAMAELAAKTVFADPQRKLRVLEMLSHPQESHARFVFLLRMFYTSYYLPVEPKVLHELEQRLSSFRDVYDKDPVEFMSRFLNSPDKPGYNKNEQEDGSSASMIHLSFFKGIGWHTYRLEGKENPRWFVLGLHSNKAEEGGVAVEQAVLFFKVLSDKKRIEIIRLLSERPCYGQELAELLDLTPATISYHMTFLLGQNMVVYERSENRYYYSLNRQVMERLFQLSHNTVFKR
ncbi:ArsR/SmtB family transcription factor [Paenibacillus sp. sgz500958]|uniref:ArsR/SmtB family transcription factor n=1 Tax=Paenibacillus sp. sgz500958 TaxID=3242475 RepID=UPI0036D2E27F